MFTNQNKLLSSMLFIILLEWIKVCLLELINVTVLEQESMNVAPAQSQAVTESSFYCKRNFRNSNEK